MGRFCKSFYEKMYKLRKNQLFLIFSLRTEFYRWQIHIGKISVKNQRIPFKNGGNDAFPIYLTGMSKNLGEKLIFRVKDRSLKIGKFRP